MEDQDKIDAMMAGEPSEETPVADDASTDATEAPAEEASQDDDALAAQWAEALASSGQEEVEAERSKENASAKAHDAVFKDMTATANLQKTKEPIKRDLDFILDIPLEVSAELGRTKLLINELLQLGQGSVIELAKLAGEPLELYVNGKLVARGEAVVINEKFGVRLTDIVSPVERVRTLA